MNSPARQFRDLHWSTRLLVLPNIWNAKSASLLQEKGFPAIATSSAAVADSLGYPDGEGMPFSDYLFVIKRILSAVNIPLSVDIEMGYGANNESIYANIRRLLDLGVAGINIEDSTIDTSGRLLAPAPLFGGTIEYIKNRLSAENADLFINVRCDTYLLDVPNKQKDTASRIQLYEAAGADGIFLPCISAEEDITAAVKTTHLPLNVMSIPGLPDLNTLSRLGVRRLSMGPFLFNKVYDTTAAFSQAIVDPA